MFPELAATNPSLMASQVRSHSRWQQLLDTKSDLDRFLAHLYRSSPPLFAVVNRYLIAGEPVTQESGEQHQSPSTIYAHINQALDIMLSIVFKEASDCGEA